MEKMQNYVVIDDDSTNNLICEFVIRKFDKDATVHLFQDPEKALNAIENGLCSCDNNTGTTIFLDINMPSMSGFELLNEFQKFPQEVRGQYTIYMLTSSIEDFTEQEKIYPFVSGFFSKPLKNIHLAEINCKKSQTGMAEYIF